jgi:hypothetical protein
MIGKLFEHWRQGPLADGESLGRFLSGEASYLAQRSTYEFTRNTLAWFGQSAFGDDKFNDAFRICRWESFASILAGFIVLTQARLSPAARGREPEVADGLVRIFEAALAAYPTPAHRADWQEIVTALHDALRAAGSQGLSPAAIGARAAERVIATVPVRSPNDAEDRQVISNAVRLGTIGVNDRLAARLVPEAMVRNLVEAAAAASRQ